MMDDPSMPIRDSSLMRLLVPQVTKPVGLSDRLIVAKRAAVLRADLNKHEANGITLRNYEVGKIKLLPFFLPGDDAMGQGVRQLG